MEEPTGQPKFGGNLRWVPQGSIKTIDQVFGTNIITTSISLHLNDLPMARDSNGGIAPQALDEWKWETANGNAQFVMTLRDGLKFHDGTDITSEDLLASIQRWSDVGDITSFWRPSLKSMQVIDDKTLVMSFEESVGALLIDMAGFSGAAPVVVPKEVAEKYTAFQAIPKGDAIGSGPYILTSWDPGNELIMERFTDYKPRDGAPSFWAGGKIAYLDRLHAIEIPEVATRVAAVMTGEVDFVDQMGLDFFDLLDSSDRAMPILGAGPEPVAFFHLENPPFDQTESGRLLRQAVLYGINPQEVMEAYGPRDLWSVCSYWWGCGQRASANAELMGQHPQNDLAKAKELLVQAGYNGEKVTLVDPADFATIHPIAVVMRATLERIGFNVDYQVTDWATEIEYQTEPVDKRSWNIMTTWGFMSVQPLAGFFLGADGNVGHYVNDELQSLRGQYAAVTGASQRKEVLDGMAAVLYEDVPYMVFGQFKTVFGVNRDLSGYIVSEFNNSPYFIGAYWDR